MGFGPQEVNAMSVWQFFALLDGWVKAHEAGGGSHLSDAEKDEIWEWMKEKETGTARTLQ